MIGEEYQMVKYEELQIEVVHFSDEDVIVCSYWTPEEDPDNG